MKKSAIVLVGIVLFMQAYTIADYSDSLNKIRGISIENACNQGIIAATVRGLGGHSENCITITLKNLTARDTLIRIESGRRLDSYDSTKQDILVVRERLITLAPGEVKQITIYGFCCQALNGSPRKGEKFSVGHMADSSLIKTAVYLYQNNISSSVAQHAIWSVSNNHSLASVNGNDDVVKDLKRYLAGVKNVEIPWYEITYAKPDSGQVFSDKVVSVSGKIAFQISNMTIGSMIVFNEKGQMVDVVFKSSPLMPDYYIYPVDLDVRYYPKGKYKIKLFTNGQKTMLEKQFEI